jgi:hypothetical protein
MSFPGFTAEASLFKTDEPYRLIGDRAGGSGRQAVIPQAFSCVDQGNGFCLYLIPGPFGGPISTIAPYGSSACLEGCPPGSSPNC